MLSHKPHVSQPSLRPFQAMNNSWMKQHYDNKLFQRSSVTVTWVQHLNMQKP